MRLSSPALHLGLSRRNAIPAGLVQRFLRFIIAVSALAVLAGPAHALNLSNIEVRSNLGQAFDGQLNYSLAPGEEIDESCFKLVAPASSDGLAGLQSATLDLNPSGRGGQLRIRSRQPVNDPIIKIVLQADCAGSAQLQREYVVLIDPPIRYAAPAQPSPPASAPSESANVASATGRSALPREGRDWSVQPGDTLATLAQTIHPRNRKARELLVRSMLDANPQFAGLAPEDPLPAGSTVLIPRQAQNAGTTPKAASETPAVRASKPRAKPSERSAKAAPNKAAPAQANAGFRLKLSSGEVDLSLSDQLTEQDRARLREKQLLLDADDQVSNLLALKNSVRDLQAQLAEMQTQLAAAKISAENAAPKTQPAPAPTAAAKTQAMPAPTGKPEPSQTAFDWVAKYWSWLLAAALALILVAYLALRRRPQTVPITAYHAAPARREMTTDADKPEEEMVDLDFHDQRSPDANASPEAASDPHTFYRNMIRDQFPGLQSGQDVVPDDLIAIANDIDKRGEKARAIQLIEFGLEERPEYEPLWLTQLEFLRQDGRRSAYEQLTTRYRERFPESDKWSAVQAGGRFLDPDNALYADPRAIAADPLDLDFDITGGSGGKTPGEQPSVKPIKKPAAPPLPDPSVPLDFVSSSDEAANDSQELKRPPKG
jgi:hypothetical protein